MAEKKRMENRYLHRILLIALGSTLAFGLILGRLYYLQNLRSDYYRSIAADQQVKTEKLTPRRGSILTAEGHPLATSAFLETAYISPRAIRDCTDDLDGLALDLAHCLDLPPSRVRAKVFHEGRADQLLGRRLPPRQVRELLSVRQQYGLRGYALYFVKEGSRQYPKGRLAAHVVGMTRADDHGDNVGAWGVEKQYDDTIAGRLIEEIRTHRVQSTREDSALLEASGNDVVLTINEQIQHFAEEALAAQVERFEAEGGVCLVMEVGSGAVLAMASAPGFDLNRPGEAPHSAMTNRCLMHPISPGSVMKTFITASLLERNRVSPYEEIDCRNGYHVFPGGRRIKDSHGLGRVPVLEAFAESSNIGYVQLGLRLSAEELHADLRRYGFGSPTGIDLPNERRGVLRDVSDWTRDSRMSLPIGYELTVTPIQVAAAMAAIANDGLYVRPRVLKEIRSPRGELLYRPEPEALRRVCSPQTSELVLRMMEEVVVNGTGKGRAEVPGYRVGGKTGTTVKDDAPGPGDDPDEPRYYASFLGVAPVDAPRVVVYVWLDEPNRKWGSTVAAPVFAQVAAHCMRILDVTPNELVVARGPEAEAGAPTTETVEAPVAMAVPALPGRVGPGRMPDLLGLTLREAVEELHHAKIDAKLVGWGVASQQRPLPDQPLTGLTHALVVFEPPYEQD